jgi:hypothetical protein
MNAIQQELVSHAVGFLEGVAEALESYVKRIQRGELSPEVLSRTADDMRREATNLAGAMPVHGASSDKADED